MLNTTHALLPGRLSRLRPALPAPRNRPAPQYLRSLWYVLYFPQLTQSNNPDPRLINELASACLQVSDHIAVVRDDALVLEIRGSLKYFGGIRGIRHVIQIALQTRLQQWDLPDIYYDAASPSASASASILLARTGLRQLVADTHSLRSALGSVAMAKLALDAKTLHRLKQCSLLHLRDLWRLPPAGLHIRFGRVLSDYLAQLLAQRASALNR